MATISKSNVSVYPTLSIVTVRGFKPEAETATDPATGAEWQVNPIIDPPGTANWLVTDYGMASDDYDARDSGIIHTDYDSSSDRPWDFSVLIASDEVDAFRESATEAGYEVITTETVTEPCVYGDGGGTVVLAKHPDGWIILD